MTRPDIAVFDTETTGLTLHPDADLHKTPRCIEFGGVILSGKTGEIIHECNWLIDPEEDITEEITKITGITTADVRGQPTFAELLPEIARYFRKAGAVVAHNLPFDKSIIEGECLRILRSTVGDTQANEANMLWWPHQELCTVGLYREQWGRHVKMTQLYEHILGKPLAQTHRALDDVKALVEIIQHERLWELI